MPSVPHLYIPKEYKRKQSKHSMGLSQSQIELETHCRAEYAQLRAENDRLRAENDQLRAENDRLRRESDEQLRRLTERIGELEAQVQKLSQRLPAPVVRKTDSFHSLETSSHNRELIRILITTLYKLHTFRPPDQ